MKRKSSRRSGKSDEDENGLEAEEEVDSSEEPQAKKGRRSKGKKSKPLKSGDTESELETGQSEDSNEVGSRKENGNTQGSKGKKQKQRKEIESDDEADPLAGDNDAEYEVQAIIDEKIAKGVRQYLIRWKGYTEESDTWEPEDTLDCQDLIKEFKEKTKKETSKKSSTKKKEENEHEGKGKEGKTKEGKVKEGKVKEGKEKAGKGKARKEKKESISEETWDENEDFEVDRILDVYFHRNGKKDFLVSWKGYPSAQNSWEPEDNMDCKDLILKFMEKVEQARKFEGKESKLRVNPKPVNRLEFSMHEKTRRLSKRRGGKDRVHYFDAE